MIKFTSLGYDWENRNTPAIKDHTKTATYISKKYGQQGFDNPSSFSHHYCYISGHKHFVKEGAKQMLKSLLRHIHKIENVQKAIDRINGTTGD